MHRVYFFISAQGYSDMDPFMVVFAWAIYTNRNPLLTINVTASVRAREGKMAFSVSWCITVELLLS